LVNEKDNACQVEVEEKVIFTGRKRREGKDCFIAG